MTQSSYAKGYQQALTDIALKIREGGLDAAQEWIDNNLPNPKCPTDAGTLIWCEDNWACLKCGAEWAKGQV
jgi:hypothetical protein